MVLTAAANLSFERMATQWRAASSVCIPSAKTAQTLLFAAKTSRDKSNVKLAWSMIQASYGSNVPRRLYHGLIVVYASLGLFSQIWGVIELMQKNGTTPTLKTFKLAQKYLSKDPTISKLLAQVIDNLTKGNTVNKN